MLESLEQFVKVGAMNVARLAELSAVLIIAAAVLEGLWRSVRIFARRDHG